MPISEVYNEDNMIGMARFPDKFFDLATVDPEWGRGEDGGKNRGKLVRQKSGARTYVPSGDYKKKSWDRQPSGEEYFKELFRVSKHQIIWGCNYFPVLFGPGRIIWDKCNDGSDQSAAEIAYNSLTTRVDMFRYMWRGMLQGKSIKEGTVQQGNKKLNEKRIHPTQKPVKLYNWILLKYAQPGFKILDTHMGSQSSRIAAFNMGFDYWGWEIDNEYFEAGNKRFKEQTAKLKLL
jgi:site-specific DNA-methyltransferase (adenine-specific)